MVPGLRSPVGKQEDLQTKEIFITRNLYNIQQNTNPNNCTLSMVVILIQFPSAKQSSHLPRVSLNTAQCAPRLCNLRLGISEKFDFLRLAEPCFRGVINMKHFRSSIILLSFHFTYFIAVVIRDYMHNFGVFPPKYDEVLVRNSEIKFPSFQIFRI